MELGGTEPLLAGIPKGIQLQSVALFRLRGYGMKMVEVKVSELSGAALDYAVAIADGGERKPYQFADNEDAPFWDAWVFPGGRAYSSFTPSTKWSHCGPLIEANKIAVNYDFEDGEWIATDLILEEWVCGETPLIAACRAIVASKLGDTVSVPAELVESV